MQNHVVVRSKGLSMNLRLKKLAGKMPAVPVHGNVAPNSVVVFSSRRLLRSIGFELGEGFFDEGGVLDASEFGVEAFGGEKFGVVAAFDDFALFDD